MTITVVSIAAGSAFRELLPQTSREVVGGGRVFLYYHRQQPEPDRRYQHDGELFVETRSFRCVEEANVWVACEIAARRFLQAAASTGRAS